ncbi:hypothetical protein HYD71_02630 [Mycoplasmopsis bovis]|nr:hypothetical protein [Mycoplasmopsis bovis]QQH49558.1 hypothetical protein HYD71_02630 [Mycoplasmopsis bovis]
MNAKYLNTNVNLSSLIKYIKKEQYRRTTNLQSIKKRQTEHKRIERYWNKEKLKV